MRVTIDHPSPNGLSQESWAFYVADSWHDYDGIAVVLDSYTVSRRLTANDKFRAESEWSRWATRGFGSVTRLVKPPEVPQWVRTNVIKKINESISFLQQTDTLSRVVTLPESQAESERPRIDLPRGAK
jgi:hypothetical protein